MLPAGTMGLSVRWAAATQEGREDQGSETTGCAVAWGLLESCAWPCTLHARAPYQQRGRVLSILLRRAVTWVHHMSPLVPAAQEIFRRQLKQLLAVLGDRVELVDLQGGLLSKQVRFDERGVKNMALLHKIFGMDQVLREHAVTKYDESHAAEYPPHGTFWYDRLGEGLSHLEAQLQRHGSVDALLGFSQVIALSWTMLHMMALACRSRGVSRLCVVGADASFAPCMNTERAGSEHGGDACCSYRRT